MEVGFNIKDVSFFKTSLPLSAQVEHEYSYCLPSSMEHVSLIRKQEYIAGRICAFNAAKVLGVEVDSLPNAETRNPIWPKDIIGSISHSKLMAISCVARTETYLALGIDAEELIKSETALEIQSTIASLEEVELLGPTETTKPLTILFSAKEALYKALFPLVKTFIDFTEVKLINLNLHAETFELKLSSSQPALSPYLGLYQGSFKVLGDTIVTLVTIPKDKHAYS